MVNKRGLSNIVATVLIVLLALAAVAIVWGFLRPTFDRGSSQTALQNACFLVEFDVTKCTINDNNATVVYQLKKYDDKLNGVVVIVENDEGTTKTEGGDAPTEVLMTEKATVTSVSCGDGGCVAKVAARVTDGRNTIVCAESAPLTCGEA